MRQDTISLLMAQKENDIQNFVSFITKDSIQKSLKFYLDSLKKPRVGKWITYLFLALSLNINKYNFKAKKVN